MKFTTRTRSYGDRREDTRTRLKVRPVDDHRGQRVHDPAPRVVNIVRAHQRLLFVPEHAAHLVRGGVLDERVDFLARRGASYLEDAIRERPDERADGRRS